MDLPKQVKFALWLAGTLVVGALGNGLWELAKPGLVWLFSVALDIATLGLSSLRDSLYVEIARGTYERAAEKVLTIILSLMAMVPLTLLLVPAMRRTVGNAAAINPAAIKRKRWLAVSYLAVIVLTLVIQNIRIIYIVRAANHMEQLLRVVAPFQSERERLLLMSRFASMETRQQYIALTNELAEIARKHNARVPDFDIY